MITFRNTVAGVFILSFFSSSILAFSSKEDQINHYLELLSNSNAVATIQMLERLQWSGLMDPRFFDVIEANVIGQSQDNNIGPNAFKVLGYQVRALGYSGNEKYRDTLKEVKDNALELKIRGYAKKALRDMKRFSDWNTQIANSEFAVKSKPVEIETYMKMLNVDDPSVQKLAARAIYHEQQDDHDLLSLAAEKLKAMYLKEGLNREAQDTAAWLSKAIGQNGGEEFVTLLIEVVEKTPYKQIRRHAAKFTP